MEHNPERLLAWQALSELFLDTELDGADIASIARRLRATGLSASEITYAYEHEVAPVCWRNLEAAPGGASAGFQLDWLVDAIERHRSGRSALAQLPLIQHLRVRRWTASTRADWERVRQLLDAWIDL
jgi:hypothetical protein